MQTLLPEAFRLYVVNLLFKMLTFLGELFVEFGDVIILKLMKTQNCLYLGNELTFPEFHFETEAKVDFPSACI